MITPARRGRRPWRTLLTSSGGSVEARPNRSLEREVPIAPVVPRNPARSAGPQPLRLRRPVLLLHEVVPRPPRRRPRTAPHRACPDADAAITQLVVRRVQIRDSGTRLCVHHEDVAVRLANAHQAGRQIDAAWGDELGAAPPRALLRRVARRPSAPPLRLGVERFVQRVRRPLAAALARRHARSSNPRAWRPTTSAWSGCSRWSPPGSGRRSTGTSPVCGCGCSAQSSRRGTRGRSTGEHPGSPSFQKSSSSRASLDSIYESKNS